MSATFSTGIPNFFTSPMAAFPSRNLFHSAERPAEGGVGGTTFTHEDRLMLQLLYQQQQAIQIQLQSMALSMQQLHMALAGLSKPPMTMSTYGSALNEVNASTNATVSAPMATQSSVNDTVEAMTSAQCERQNHHPERKNATTAYPSARASSAKETSRSCTPPRDDLDMSHHSATNHSTESVAPWDPSAGSRQSSVVRAARAENPLLLSLRGKLPTPNRSGAASVSGGTGYTASANISASLEDSKPTVRPTLHPSSSSLSAETEAQNVSSSRHTAARSQNQQRIVLDNRKVDPSHRLHSSAEISAEAVDLGREDPRHGTEWNSTSSHHYREGKEEGRGVNASALGYDSQSDGYGSYETRQYLKSVGII
ncbi:hypothetical protein DQ04_00571100 [Trypanosoma grayi]|uniref:hypothetical protein n=1 Tax=Trypanosoma grayi TaxID=71804 RepID=UPI0004F3FFA3|nr:hypothetical protein DQ04_00571100 [Trypanosoma grayi]KEG14215.1 hypothetical protein DQ04_00571100 [Trypanosoma grayi]